MVFGILVAGRTHPLSPRAAQAQTESEEVTVPSFITAGSVIRVNRGEVVAPVISAYGVSVDGVPTDFVLGDKVEVLYSFILSDNITSIYGVGISGELTTTPKDGVGISGEFTTTPKEGVGISGELTTTPKDGVGISGERPTPTEGVGISGEVIESDVAISADSEVQVTGGQLTGDNIRVENGVLRGENLRLVGATVSGTGLTLSGLAVAAPGY